jgi:hypothetical protein
VRETRSLLRCHLVPHLGHQPVTKLTTVDIDDLYAYLLRRGGRDGQPWVPGTVHRVHVACAGDVSSWLEPSGAAADRRAQGSRHVHYVYWLIGQDRASVDAPSVSA